MVFSILLAGLLISGLLVTSAEAQPKFAAIAVDARTGEVLFSRDADGLRHPASLTKVMTLYLLFQDLKAKRLTLKSKLRASKKAAGQPPTRIGLKPGETITVENAIKALVTRSANDVAVVVAENLGGTESAFANRMTKTARALGMKRTLFRNASGLPNPSQITTARDMAILSLRIQRDFPQYYHFFRLETFSYKGKSVRNHNKLLGRYSGTDGIKTGYIRASGFNLTSSVRRGNKRIVGVVLGARSGNTRNSYMMAMLDAALPECNEGTGIAANVRKKGSYSAADAAPAKKKKKLWQKGEAETATDVIDERSEPQALAGGIGVAEDAEEADDSAGKAFAAVTVEDGALEDAWNIQVGAYPTEDDAEAGLAVARKVATRVLKNSQAKTIEVQSGETTIYRARFTGLSEAQARSACKALAAKRRDCLLVQPQS